MNGAAPRLTNSINSVLEDKELMRMNVDWQKRFPIYHVLCGTAIRKLASTFLQVSDEVGMTLVDW